MSVIQVTTRDELARALQAATGGETIRLGPGPWPYLNIGRPKRFERPVTVEPEVRNTLVAGWTWKGWGGIALRGFDVRRAAASVIELTDCTAMVVEDCRAIGEAEPNRDPWDNGATGIRVTSCQGVTVTDCDMTDCYRGAALTRSRDVRFEGNRIWQVREGLTLAALTDSLVARNEISDLWARYDKAEHPDAIQVQNAAQPSGCVGLEISDNRLVLLGRRAVHGIFCTVQSTRADMRHRNVSIVRNLVVCSAKHGISVSGTDAFLIAENIVLSTLHSGSGYARGQDGGRTSAGLTPAINTADDSLGLARDNCAHWYALGKGTVSERNRQGWPMAEVAA